MVIEKTEEDAFGEEQLATVRAHAKEMNKFHFFDLIQYVSFRAGVLIPLYYTLGHNDHLENNFISLGIAAVGFGTSYVFDRYKTQAETRALNLRNGSDLSRKAFVRLDEIEKRLV